MLKTTFKYTEIFDYEETYNKYLHFHNKNIGCFTEIINIKSINIID
jgi:hypothetical protein